MWPLGTELVEVEGLSNERNEVECALEGLLVYLQISGL